MAWKVTVKDKAMAQGKANFTLTFDDGAGQVFDRSYAVSNPPDQYLERVVASEVAALQALGDYVAGVTVGQEVSPYKPADPTDDQKAANSFFALLAKMRALQDAAAKGVINADDQGLSDVSVAVKAAYKPEYATDPRWR